MMKLKLIMRKQFNSLSMKRDAIFCIFLLETLATSAKNGDGVRDTCVKQGRLGTFVQFVRYNHRWGIFMSCIQLH